MLAIAVKLGLFIHQLDVKTAFLHGELKEEIYMAIPEGVPVEGGKVCKLLKSLYGLKQAPRCWNEKFNGSLVKLGYRRSLHDYCLYFKVDKNQENVLFVVID